MILAANLVLLYLVAGAAVLAVLLARVPVRERAYLPGPWRKVLLVAVALWLPLVAFALGAAFWERLLRGKRHGPDAHHVRQRSLVRRIMRI